MNKKVVISFVAVVMVVMAAWMFMDYKNGALYDGTSELSDEELLSYAQARFSKEKMWGKRMIIGSHHGIPVRGVFPCSDVCPDYTIRIIRYDIDLDKCKEAGGIIKAILVPRGIAAIQLSFCFPKVIVLSDIYEFTDVLNPPSAEELQYL